MLLSVFHFFCKHLSFRSRVFPKKFKRYYWNNKNIERCESIQYVLHLAIWICQCILRLCIAWPHGFLYFHSDTNSPINRSISLLFVSIFVRFFISFNTSPSICHSVCVRNTNVFELTNVMKAASIFLVNFYV